MAVFILETDYSSKIILKPCHFHIERNYLPDANYPTENLSEMENRERKQRRRRRQRERQKIQQVCISKTTTCTYITRFVHFGAVFERLRRETS